jgi:superfamily II DNA or RNA helicase
MSIALRDYQRDALSAVADLCGRGARRLIVAVPTGGGKTIIFAHLAESLGLAPSDKILILAHRDELVEQAVEKYLTVNPAEMIGVEKGARRASPMDRVCVASVQTLHNGRIGDFLARFGRPALIVTDEAHHAVAPGYAAIYEACGVTRDGQTIHIGVTATPKRADKIGLDGTFDAVAYSIGIGDLVRRGHLVPLVGYRVRTQTDLDGVRVVAGEFNQGDLGRAVDTPERNARVVQAYDDTTPGRKALVFAASVEHSKNLQRTFVDSGYRAGHVDGEMKLEDRRAVLRAFHDGDLDVLCNCAVLTEGYDEPTIEVVIIARPTKSTVMYAQMVGRATRLSPGKSKAAVIDMVDATRKHSVVSLPSLLGLPPSFNLGGRNATDIAERYQRLADRDPNTATMVQDAATLAMLEGVPNEEQRVKLTRKLLDQAKASNTYISVDLFRPPAMPADADEFTRMVWVPLGDDSYRLRLRNATIHIDGDVVGNYAVVLRHENGTTQNLGSCRGMRDAFTHAEAWVRNARGENLAFLEKRVAWRQKPATPKQLSLLKKFRVKTDPQITSGEASDALDNIMQGLASGKMHAPRRAS